jgi:hypothetical protein
MALDQTLSQQLDIDNEIEVAGEHFVFAQGLQKEKKSIFNLHQLSALKNSNLTNIKPG